MYSERQNSTILQKIFCLFLGTLICVFCFFVAETGARAELIVGCVEIPRDDFPVRSEASDRSAVLITLAKGALLYPESMSGNWYKVPFNNNLYGYVHKDYVTAVDVRATVSAFPGATLKAGAGDSYDNMAILSPGTEVIISGVDGVWAKVIPYNSTDEGYILIKSTSFGAKVLFNVPNDTSGDDIITVIATTANLRSDAGTQYSIVTTLKYGDQLVNIGTKMGADGYNWYYVKTIEGISGYIRSDLVGAITIGGGLSGKTIVVDPGHGSYKSEGSGFDVGAVGPSGIREKDINLKIALYLKGYLEADGAKVIMTRTSDTGVLSLTGRANIANNANADLFISVHCNASDASSANGTETYYSTVDVDKVPIDELLLSSRKAVATAVQSNLVGQLGRTNRGVKTSNFTVITATKMPSILIETAFISNPTEERLLNSASFQDSAAKGCYLGIRSYFN